MSILVAIRESGPFQGNLATIAKQEWPDALIIELGSSRILNSEVCVPLWAKPFISGASSTLVQRFFRELARQHEITQIIAVGVHAALPIATLLPGIPIDLVIQKGELDFGYKRSRKQTNLLAAVVVAERLWLDDYLEMDKVVGHGSTKPHLLTPIMSLPTALWDHQRTKPKVAFIYPQSWDNAKVQARVDALLSWSETDLDHMQIAAEALYGYQDLSLNRGFPGTFKYRLGTDLTHVVLLGDSSAHLSVVAALAKSSVKRLFMDGTIRNRLLGMRVGVPERNIARGAALGERLGVSLQEWSSNENVEECPGLVLDAKQALDKFETANRQKLSWWYEEGIADPSFQTGDIFFTTAAIEDRADGARPQRIRAMSEAMVRPGASTLRLTSNQNILRRRTVAYAELLDSGLQPGYGYGENSTVPMSAGARQILVQFLKRTTPRGLKFGWFVRDLQWLSEESPAFKNYSAEDLHALRASGIRELEELSDVSASLFAPSVQSGTEFQALLRRAGHEKEYSWQPLPPAAFDEQILSGSGPADHQTDDINFVYSGGFGGVYDIDLLFDALETVDFKWKLELIVRPIDIPLVKQAVEKLPEARVSIHTGEFRDWRPREGRNLGVVLLNSEYGNASFPFKTVSYLEKRMHILAYEGTPAAEFAEKNGVGVTCKPSVQDIRDALIEFARAEPISGANWDRALSDSTWNVRANQVRMALQHNE